MTTTSLADPAHAPTREHRQDQDRPRQPGASGPRRGSGRSSVAPPENASLAGSGRRGRRAGWGSSTPAAAGVSDRYPYSTRPLGQAQHLFVILGKYLCDCCRSAHSVVESSTSTTARRRRTDGRFKPCEVPAGGWRNLGVRRRAGVAWLSSGGEVGEVLRRWGGTCRRGAVGDLDGAGSAVEPAPAAAADDFCVGRYDPGPWSHTGCCGRSLCSWAWACSCPCS